MKIPNPLSESHPLSPADRIFPSCVNLNKMALARSALAAGETDFDVSSLMELLRTNKLKFYRGIMARHLAEILFHLGEAHFAEAEFWLQAAILDHEQQGMKWDLAKDYTALCAISKITGSGDREKDNLSKALLLFEECGAEGWARTTETGCAQG